MSDRIDTNIVYDLPTVGAPAISPDGASVAYIRRQVDRDSAEGDARIELIPFSGGGAKRLTQGPRDGAPLWSPDGSQLAFLRAAGAKSPRQLWLLPTDGGEARQLTDLPYAIETAVWLPRRVGADRRGRCRSVTSDRRRPAAHDGDPRYLLPRRRAGLPRRRLAPPLPDRRPDRRGDPAHLRRSDRRPPHRVARRTLDRLRLRPRTRPPPAAAVRIGTLRRRRRRRPRGAADAGRDVGRQGLLVARRLRAGGVDHAGRSAPPGLPLPRCPLRRADDTADQRRAEPAERLFPAGPAAAHALER